MKIVQSIGILNQRVTATTDSITTSRGYLRFIPARFSGIQAIYFDACGLLEDTGEDAYVELYDVDASSVIATLTFNGTTIQKQTSADIKSSLTETKNLVVRYYRDNDVGGSRFILCSASLIVVQSDDTASKKTAIQMNMCLANTTTTNSLYQGNEIYKQKLFKSANDGTIKAYLEAWLWSTGTGTSYVRLYDATAGQVVTGSELSVNSTTPTYAISGELSLTDSHEYYVQYRNGTSGQTAYHNDVHLTQTVEAFTKCVAIVCEIGYTNSLETTGWKIQSERSYLGAKLSANTITYEWDITVSINDWNVGDHLYLKLTNKSTGTAFTGSEIDIENTGQGSWLYLRQSITPVTSDITVQYQENLQYSSGSLSNRIVAFLEGEIPTYPYVPPDPTMPAGYHCFMSNFLKNVTANYRPLATPDGVNRLY